MIRASPCSDGFNPDYVTLVINPEYDTPVTNPIAKTASVWSSKRFDVAVSEVPLFEALEYAVYTLSHNLG